MNAAKFALIFVAALLAAQISGWPLIDRLVYFLAGMLALSFVLSRVSLHNLRLWREQTATRGQVGDRFVERLRVENASWLPRLWVELHDLSSLPDHHASRVLTLGGHSRQTWTIETPLRVRGRFQLGPVRLRGGDPFGLFPVERALRGASEVLVYPATLPLTVVPLIDGLLPGGGVAHRRTLQATPHVASIRDYTPGDSLNRISWSTTARLGRLMVKEFDLDPTADIWLVLDMQRAVQQSQAIASPSLKPWQTSTEEFCVTIAASLAVHFLNQQRAVGLIAGGQHREIIPTDRSPRQLVKLMEALAVIRAEGEQPLGELLLAEAACFTRQSTLVVITPSTDDAWVSVMAHSHVRGSVILIDPATFGGPESPLLVVGQLAAVGLPSIVLRRDDDLSQAMSMPSSAMSPRPMRFTRGGA